MPSLDPARLSERELAGKKKRVDIAALPNVQDPSHRWDQLRGIKSAEQLGNWSRRGSTNIEVCAAKPQTRWSPL